MATPTLPVGSLQESSSTHSPGTSENPAGKVKNLSEPATGPRDPREGASAQSVKLGTENSKPTDKNNDRSQSNSSPTQGCQRRSLNELQQQTRVSNTQRQSLPNERITPIISDSPSVSRSSSLPSESQNASTSILRPGLQELGSSEQQHKPGRTNCSSPAPSRGSVPDAPNPRKRSLPASNPTAQSSKPSTSTDSTSINRARTPAPEESTRSPTRPPHPQSSKQALPVIVDLTFDEDCVDPRLQNDDRSTPHKRLRPNPTPLTPPTPSSPRTSRTHPSEHGATPSSQPSTPAPPRLKPPHPKFIGPSTPPTTLAKPTTTPLSPHSQRRAELYAIPAYEPPIILLSPSSSPPVSCTTPTPTPPGGLNARQAPRQAPSPSPHHQPPPPHTSTWPPALYIALSDTLQRAFDFTDFARRHDRDVREVLEVFSRVIQMPLCEEGGRVMGLIREERRGARRG